MPCTDQPEPPDSSSDSHDTLDDILGAAYGRASGSAGVSSGSADVPEMPEAIGPFRILKTLGRGGMGLVYLAEDTRLADRRVAIKVLTGAGAGDGPPRARLLREAEAASKLDHPGICAVYEVGEADGVPYIAMRFVDGEPLSAKVRHSREALASGEHSALLDPPGSSTSGASQPSELTSSGGSGERAEVVRVIQLIEKAARALHAAHESHLIHRDVKPANIMVTPDGEPVLLDFGLARMADSDLPSLTRTGQLVGTPAYMAPEQIDADRGPIDRRTDVYGLGVTLQECLTLVQPFVGATREQLYRNILEEEPKPIRRINARLPRDLEAVVATALEKSPARRYQTALELAEDLRRVREHEPTHARPIRPLERMVRYARRRPTRAALIALLVVGIPLVAAMAGYIVAKQPAIAQQEDEQRQAQIEEHLQDGFDALLFKVDRDRAVAAFDAALELDLSSVEAVGGKALALLESRDAEESLAFLRAHESQLREEPALKGLVWDALKLLNRDQEAIAIEIGQPTTSFGFFLQGARQMRGFLTQRDKSRFRTALEYFRLAIMSTKNARLLYHRHLAQVANRLDDPEIAREVALVATTTWPGESAGWASACVALSRTEPEKALIAIDRAIQLEPESAELHYKRGAVLSKLDRNEKALTANQRAIACDPKDATAWTGLGVVLINLGRADEAVPALEKATELAPRWYAPWRRLARARYIQDRYEDALAAVNRALSLRADDLEGWMLKGMILDLLKQPGAAIEALNRAVAIDDQHAPAHRAIGRVRYKERRIEEAKAAFKRAIDCDSSLACAYADLGTALRYGENPDFDAAILMLGKAISLDRTNPTYRFGLGRAHQDNKEYGKAIEAYDQAIQLRPDYAEAYNNRGAAHYRLKRYDRAIADGLKTIELRPKHVGARGLLATVYSRRGEYEIAAKTFEEAVELASNLPDLWFGLAQARAKLGETNACLAALQRCAAVATSSWPHCKNLAEALGKTEMRVLGRARSDAIIGFGTLPTAGGNAEALVHARDAAVMQFELLIEGWRQAVKRGGTDARRVALIIEHLFEHAEFGAIPGSKAFKQLPEAEQARWLEVWRALRELE